MSELNRVRQLKLINPSNPDFIFIREMLQQSIEFIEDHTEIMVLNEIEIEDIFNLLPGEILSIKDVYIQKTLVLKNNFIAIGKMMEDEAKLYSVMFASRNPGAFVFDVKNDFGIDIKIII